MEMHKATGNLSLLMLVALMFLSAPCEAARTVGGLAQDVEAQDVLSLVNRTCVCPC